MNIRFTRGDTYAIKVTLEGVTEDLTSAYFSVKDNPDDEEYILQKSLDRGISKLDTGVYKIQIQSQDTYNMECNYPYLFDIQVALGNVVKTIAFGELELDTEITRNKLEQPTITSIVYDFESEKETITYSNGDIEEAEVDLDVTSFINASYGSLETENQLKNYLNGIAVAINEVTGETDDIVGSDFTSKIGDLTYTNGDLSITENGTYDVKNYKNAIVEVEGAVELNIKYSGNKNDILGNTDHTQLCVYIGDTNVNKVIAEDVEKPQDSVEIVTRDNKFVNLRETMGAKVNNIWYVFGGVYNSSGSSNYTTYKYNLVTNTYTTTTNIPYKVYLGVAIAYNTNIYIFGGCNDSSTLNTIYKFDTTTETFTKLSATLPTAVRTYSCGGCLATNGNIYIFGGYNGSSGTNQILKFDTTTETITKLNTTLPFTAYMNSCVAYGNYIYIFIGKTILKFDITNETITKLSTTLEYSAYCLAEIIGDYIYITGGTMDYDVINIFNVKTETIVSNSLKLPIPTKEDSIITKHLNSIYIANGIRIENSIININTISDPIPLNQNNLLLSIGEKTDYKFKLLNGDTADIDYYIKNVYIGNSNNNAVLIDAYVYKSDGWYNVNTGEKLS